MPPGLHSSIDIKAHPESEELLARHRVSMEMGDLGPSSQGDKSLARVQTAYTDETENAESSGGMQSRDVDDRDNIHIIPEGQTVYRVYKIRWFGLIQLVLLNIVVSWDWLSYAPVANTAADYFSTNPSVINWLSIAFFFAFVAATPVVIYTLHTGGPRLAIISSSLLILLGNWVRYGGTRATSFGLTMFGQILIGFAQPFVLSAPTRYSDLWFSPRGRVSATAIASLANPFGGALGQLICPFLATKPSEIPSMTLYVAIISTVASVPSFFIPAKPRTPVSASSTHTAPALAETFRLLSRNTTFWLVFIPFSVYVGLFNSISSILTQILTPYSFTEEGAGIAGAVLILVGLVSAAITSPIIDRTKAYLVSIKILVPVVALCYFIFIWAPGTRSLPAPYVILAVLGAACFSLVPIALEWLVEVTWPVGPEASSTVCWAGGQLLGGIFIIVSDALKEGKDADPPFTMRKALVFQAVIAAVVVPLPLVLGWVGNVRSRRLDVDKGQQGTSGRPSDDDVR